MKKVVILGSTGMLGSAVAQHCIDTYGEDNVALSYRNKEMAYGENSFFYNPIITTPDHVIPDCEFIINCIGTIKPFMGKDPEMSIWINSIFPLKLGEYCESKGIRLIHITTDCVFSGSRGDYVEQECHDALDDYGKSKSLGEICKKDCMVLRTSIIGEELHKFASLISWAKSKEGKKVNGFINHFWNGVTTKQFGKICTTIIDNGLWQKGLYHVFSDVVSKYTLLQLINERFNLNLEITPYKAEILCDRTLATSYNLCGMLDIPPIATQIQEM